MKQKKMTAEQLKEYFNNYHQYLKSINEFKETTKYMLPAAATQQYGIEATMPKGNGGNSDPVFNQVVHGVVSDSFIQSRTFLVQAIGKYTRHIKGKRETQVLELWLKGKNTTETGVLLGVNQSTVSRTRDDIIKAIMKGEGFDG